MSPELDQKTDRMVEAIDQIGYARYSLVRAYLSGAIGLSVLDDDCRWLIPILAQYGMACIDEQIQVTKGDDK